MPSVTLAIPKSKQDFVVFAADRLQGVGDIHIAPIGCEGVGTFSLVTTIEEGLANGVFEDDEVAEAWAILLRELADAIEEG